MIPPMLHSTAVSLPDAEPATVLVVDDTPANLTLMSSVLREHWRVQLANSGAKALELAHRQAPDLILLDIMMPGLDGYETCRQLKADPRLSHVPVLFLTAMTQPEDEIRGFECGAADFIHKPFNPHTVVARVRTQIEAKAGRDALRSRETWLQAELDKRLDEVNRLRDATLHVMISFAEFRDEDTGFHVKRTQEYVRVLATQLNTMRDASRHMPVEQVDHVARSAPLHDLGKVAIPDHILLKPGKLTEPEMIIMKTHAERGWDMLSRAADRMGSGGQEFLHYGMQIARSHHERWDGRGYPDGLAGEAIPLSARLMAVADVYDALISRRPYKEPMSHAAACAYIEGNAGAHFDPLVVQAFSRARNHVQAIARRWRDEIEIPD
jgi:putative two-component system response regulator